MSDYCVVVTDGAKARLFTLTPPPGVAESGPDLVEISDLANPEAEAQGKEIYSDEHSGRNVGPAGASAHRYDDHRDRHIAETERRFAKDIVAAAAKALEREHAHTVVLAANPRMMGHLREAMGSMNPELRIKELQKDLVWLTASELHEQLAAEGLLPARQAADSLHYTPSGQHQ